MRNASGRLFASKRRPNGLLAIMRKEMRRFFTDRRMVISTLLLPGLMFYVVYSFTGGAMSSQFSVSDDYQPTISVFAMPDSLKPLADAAQLRFHSITAEALDGTKQSVASKETDLLVVFPSDFDQQLDALIASAGHETKGAQLLANALVPLSEAGVDSRATDATVNAISTNALFVSDPRFANQAATKNALLASDPQAPAVPRVEIYLNSTRTESSAAYGEVIALLNSYKEALFPLFTINDGDVSYDLATKEEETGFLLATIVPMLLMIFLYTGCISVAPESIAGEKERGTIATLLVTPLKRWELALGKVASLGLIALLSGASSFIGVILAMSHVLDQNNGSLDISLYGFTNFLMLLLVILSTVLMLVGVICVISAFARTVKEANTLMMPLMVVVMLVVTLSIFTQNAANPLFFYLIPCFNSVKSMMAIFAFSGSALHVALTVCANLLAAALCVVVLTRMFSSERVIFNR
ncbi:MAG: ABC transporter permease [Coriobacteriales bacterium]|jgi:sodium transport system permease protein|nr:ABC transporter permease [Coriobacteriales bacterium]